MKIQGCVGCSNHNITRFNLCKSCQPINNIVSPKSTIHFILNDDISNLKKIHKETEKLEISDFKYRDNTICEIKVGSIGHGIVYDLEGNKLKFRTAAYSDEANKLYNIIEDFVDCDTINKSGGCYARILGDDQVNIDKIAKRTDKYTKVRSLYDPNKDFKTRYMRDKYSNILYIEQPNADSDIINISGFNSKQYTKELVDKTYKELVYYSL